MRSPFVAFDKSLEGVRLMAAFCAQLTKENLAFSIRQDVSGYEVVLGGY